MLMMYDLMYNFLINLFERITFIYALIKTSMKLNNLIKKKKSFIFFLIKL